MSEDKNIKLSPKHKQIIRTIIKNGKYKPTYSDQEPATKTLVKRGIIIWRDDMTGLILTELGKTISLD